MQHTLPFSWTLLLFGTAWKRGQISAFRLISMGGNMSYFHNLQRAIKSVNLLKYNISVSWFIKWVIGGGKHSLPFVSFVLVREGLKQMFCCQVIMVRTLHGGVCDLPAVSNCLTLFLVTAVLHKEPSAWQPTQLRWQEILSPRGVKPRRVRGTKINNFERNLYSSLQFPPFVVSRVPKALGICRCRLNSLPY